MTLHAPIDGYDWDLGDEHEDRTKRISAALRRAAEYRASTHPLLTIQHRTLEYPPRQRRGGWLLIGHLVPAYGDALAVFWHQATDRVQVERPPESKVVEPRPVPPPEPPCHRYRVAVAMAPDYSATVTLRPARGGTPIAVQLRRPDGKEWEYWSWAMMRLAEYGCAIETRVDIGALDDAERHQAIEAALKEQVRRLMERN